VKHKVLLALTVTVLALTNLLGQAGQRGQAPPPAGGAAPPAPAGPPGQGGGGGRGGGGRGAQGAPPQTPRAGAPFDITGYWVAVVTEDWRFRMVTPAKGDFASIPTNPAGVQVGQQWDPAKDEAAGEQCKSYGAAAIMRVPGRVHFTWDNDTTLKIETDAGQQTRLFHFGEFQPPAGPATWQGNSVANWELAGGRRGGPAAGGSLKVVTTGLRPGYLRKNGYPYSEKTTLTEYYDRTNEANGVSWLIVTTIVNDPVYLAQEFVTSTHFKKQPDEKGWSPQPCVAK
jgi:hypothetical protein